MDTFGSFIVRFSSKEDMGKPNMKVDHKPSEKEKVHPVYGRRRDGTAYF